ncbi:hypothetical protein EOPP23_17545 [Endozoicomonas sp. OPT23]|uniref:hypothetical protein n=1 Tax=Endozoicomonas sp. OPT23 TaxID=2072845 RepID=UPI00129B7F6E|nr:hypothetical protein [Endozoicomonas sp. OPT23]MRI34788.1 hypothetical protein [Endozoicomonas sp. OPT23]
MDIAGATRLNRRQVFYDQLNHPGLATSQRQQATLHYHTPVKPEGKQGLSLAEPARKAGNFLNHVIFGSNQLHFKQGSSRLEKAGVVAGQINYSAQKASSLALLGMRMACMGHEIKTGHYSIPNEGFHRSLKAFVGISVVIDALTFFKSAGSSLLQVVKDARSHHSRVTTQQLLSGYDPESRSFATNNDENTHRAKKLLSGTRSDNARSVAQVTLDRLTEVAGIAQQGAELVNSGLVVSACKVTARMLPGLGIALSAISTINAGIKTASQISALNNLAKAKAATKDPLLTSLAKHIKQERSINARKNLANTAVNLAGTAVSIGLTSTGIGAPAAYIATGAVGAGVCVGSSLFSAWHNRKLNQSREQAGKQILSKDALTSMADSNIGIAEKAFLKRLRESSGKELKESVEFLRTFGLTENTIKKLQLAPEPVAIKTLRDVLFQDKVKFKGLQLRQTAATLSHVVGLTTLAKKVKAGTAWLVEKLKPDQKTQSGKSISQPPAVKKEWFQHNQNLPESRRRTLACVSQYQKRMFRP